MIQQHAQAATPEASRIMQRLCYHFGRKVQAQCNEKRGTVVFPGGVCDMQATPAGLRFTLNADDENLLASGREVIDGHMALFTRKAPITLSWSAPSQAPVR